MKCRPWFGNGGGGTAVWLGPTETHSPAVAPDKFVSLAGIAFRAGMLQSLASEGGGDAGRFGEGSEQCAEFVALFRRPGAPTRLRFAA